jgi:hypothetical protein
MDKTASTKQLRSFGLTVGGVFFLVGLWPKLSHGQAFRWWAVALGGLLIILGAILPKSLGPAYRVWMALAQLLGWINTRLILGVVYYVVIVPIGLLMRLMNKDAMHRTFRPDLDTYRMPRKLRPSFHMKHQY